MVKGGLGEAIKAGNLCGSNCGTNCGTSCLGSLPPTVEV